MSADAKLFNTNKQLRSNIATLERRLAGIKDQHQAALNRVANLQKQVDMACEIGDRRGWELRQILVHLFDVPEDQVQPLLDSEGSTYNLVKDKLHALEHSADHSACLPIDGTKPDFGLKG